MIRVTKKHILDALKYENLVQGEWFTEDQDGYCEVCAVGGALRLAGVQDNNISETAYEATRVNMSMRATETDEELIDILLENGDYLYALSTYWESFLDEDGEVDVDYAREETIKWVEKNIPYDFNQLIKVV